MGAEKQLAGQVALVTGASSGIGKGVAMALAAEGAMVGVNYLSKPEDAQQIVRAIEEDGGRALALQADVSREDQVQAMLARLVEAFGRLDILVANAGLQKDAPIGEMTLDEWHKVIDVNLTGQFLCARAAIRQFEAQPPSDRSRAKGKIICMSSVHQVIPWAGRVNYAASKGGIMLMMQSLAQEVSSRGIRVNGIAPGAIKTPINQDAWETEEARRELLKLIPYGRIGEPEDVAKAAIWLASDQSDYVVGTTIYVDGGMLLYPGFRGNG
ncbi:SDR family oxidoreductase [Geminicoccus roseus]|uniref:SDR family oxidoreductase n=1 Tax=Geminicoccus roseus TaxID=404900 RepID=UPI00042339FB|nr:SDR family oxidoreductase [Geminicoccus roseus]